MNNQFQEQFYEMMTRMRGSGSGSRVASTSTFQEAREWSLDKNGVVVSRPIRAESKTASAAVVTQQSINLNKTKVIADFISSQS